MQQSSQPLAVELTEELGPAVEQALYSLQVIVGEARDAGYTDRAKLLRACISTLRDQLAETARLRVEVRELEDTPCDDCRDAARYRWLRDSTSAEWRPIGLRRGCGFHEADELVDKAMRSGPNVAIEPAPGADGDEALCPRCGHWKRSCSAARTASVAQATRTTK